MRVTMADTNHEVTIHLSMKELGVLLKATNMYIEQLTDAINTANQETSWIRERFDRNQNRIIVSLMDSVADSMKLTIDSMDSVYNDAVEVLELLRAFNKIGGGEA